MKEIGYIREKSIISIYKGKNSDGSESLYIKTFEKPKININSKLLKTRIFYRKDKNWGIEISLLNNNYLDVFNILCKDLIDYIILETNQMVAERKLITRYNMWQQLFDEINVKILTPNEIQGLIGELFFLKKYLIPIFGDEAVKSWGGPNGNNKDFEFENIWFEIKTKSINKDIVHISSVYQLDSEIEGFLFIINIEKTTENAYKSWSISMIIEEIEQQINSKEVLDEFRILLLKFGVFNRNENFFRIINANFYKVSKNFPRISINQNEAIHNIKYELSVSKLEKYIIRREDIGFI